MKKKLKKVAAKVKAMVLKKKPAKPAKKLEKKAKPKAALKPLKSKEVAKPLKVEKKPLSKPVAVAAKNQKDIKAPKGKAQAPALEAAQTEQEPAKEVILTNADGKEYCKAYDCDAEGAINGYCRLHYIALWKRNKLKTKILEGNKLDKYIEELTARYPDKYIEMLKKDLSNEKEFNSIISEMDMEDSGEEGEGEEEVSRFVEEVRGNFQGSGEDEEGF